MNAITPKFGVGASVLRKEDPRFLTGKGSYTDDIAIPDARHMVVVRSPYAHARFTIGDLDGVMQSPGVELVLTAAETGHLKPLRTQAGQEQEDGTDHETRDIPILCDGTVRYVGDAVAAIVASSEAQARDAAELVDIDYEPFDAAAHTGSALNEDTPLVWPELGSNLAFTLHQGDRDKTKEAFKNADRVTAIKFTANRLVANYMEPRAALAEYDGQSESFKVVLGTQGVHGARDILAETFGIAKEKIRVLTYDVGGGFGPKGMVFREYPLAMEAARRLGVSVKWTCDRTEHFLTDAQGRDNVVEAEMAMDEKGRFLGLKIDLIAAMGAYLHQFGPAIPKFGATMATGVYDIQALDMTVRGVYTHTCPTDAYRGAGRPEAAFLIEKLVDQCARDMDLSPDEIRRRNFIRPEQFPYSTPGGRTYDVGEFEGHLSEAMKRAEWNSFDDRLEESRKAGMIRGIGMATYIEACAFAGSEPAFVNLNDDGTVTLRIGTQSNGQGHETAYSQFIAEKLGVDFDKIEVRQGDSDELDDGGGTGGSRSIPLGGVSTAKASDVLAEKLKKLAADELEADAADIELVSGKAAIVGTDRSVGLADLAKSAKDRSDLEANADIHQDEATYPNGTHICEVEIDPSTGHTRILRYTIVDDFGVTVNPVLLHGQVHGGVVQGIGQCLHEETVHGDDGQLITASFMDYGVPRADDLLMFDFSTRNVKSTSNALGIKGAGEAGTIGACPAVLNAVTNALHRAYGIDHIEMAATPTRVWKAIQAAS